MIGDKLMKMTIRDLIQKEIDIDVYDDVCEELAIAFCGPQPLTPEGEKEFAEIMDYEIQINLCSYGGLPAAILCIDGLDDWEDRLRKAKIFFECAAGYCSCDDYDRLFGKDGDGK